MSKYIRKPIQIDALKYDGSNQQEIASFLDGSLITNIAPIQENFINVSVVTENGIEQIINIGPNSYVFIDVDNQIKVFYEDFFESQYELV